MSDEQNQPTPEEIDEIIQQQQRDHAVEMAAFHAEMEEEEYNKYDRLVVAPKNRDGYITIVDRIENGKPQYRMVPPDDRDFMDSSSALEQLRKDRYYIVDKVFTGRRVHMLAGPSGVNKTTWLLPTIKDWSEGKDVMGYKSYPAPYMYISCDRPLDGIGEVLERLGLQDWKICCHSLGSIREKFKLGSTRKLDVKDFTELFPRIKVFFIEGIASLRGSSRNPNDYAENMQYWSEIGHMCEDRDVTIFGVTHCAKAKPGEKYDNPRDQIIGSVGLPASTDTVMIMQFDESKDVTNKGRRLFVLPRNVAPFVMRYRLGEKGGLLPVTEEEWQENESRVKASHKQDITTNSRRTIIMDSFLIWPEVPTPITIEDIVKYATANEVSRASAYRWKDDKLETKELIEIRHMTYIKGRLQ